MKTSKRIQLDPVRLFGIKQNKAQVTNGKVTLARAMVGAKVCSLNLAKVPASRA